MTSTTKRSFVCLAIALGLVVACQSPETQDGTSEVRLAGTVRTAVGGAPVLAHVHVVDVTSGETVQSAEAAADGTFEIAAPRDGLYRLEVTAVDHEFARLPLLFDGEEAVELDVSLKRTPFLDEPEKVNATVLIPGEEEERVENVELKRRDDGTWAGTLTDLDAEQVKYEITGATASGRLVNGTLSEGFEYDGGGDYYSILGVKDGRVDIVFDPSALPPASAEPRPAVASSSPALARALELEREVEAAAVQLRPKSKEERVPDLDRAEVYATARAALLAALDDESAPESLRSFAAVRIVTTPREACSKEEVRRAVSRLAPESLYWALSPGAVGRLDATEDGELVLALRNENPVAGVRGRALAQMIQSAKMADDKERWHELYTELVDEFGEEPGLRFYVRMLNPRQRIAVGNELPEFELALLDGDGTAVSNKTLNGRYTLIDFWATWCGPCVAELPRLHQAYEKWGGERFQILSLSFDEKVEDIKPFRDKEFAMPWLHAFVENGFDSEVSKQFEVFGIPYPILVDPEGKIVATYETLRGDDLFATLAEQLGDGAAG